MWVMRRSGICTIAGATANREMVTATPKTTSAALTMPKSRTVSSRARTISTSSCPMPRAPVPKTVQNSPDSIVWAMASAPRGSSAAPFGSAPSGRRGPGAGRRAALRLAGTDGVVRNPGDDEAQEAAPHGLEEPLGFLGRFLRAGSDPHYQQHAVDQRRQRSGLPRDR